MTSHLWPHNIQHIWPVLNVPALGLNLRHIGLFGFVHWGKRGGFHPYSVGLLKAIASTYNLTTFPPVLAQNQGPSWWRKASVNLRTLHCFERVVVPNKGPSPKFQVLNVASPLPFPAPVPSPYSLFEHTPLGKRLSCSFPFWPTVYSAFGHMYDMCHGHVR